MIKVFDRGRYGDVFMIKYRLEMARKSIKFEASISGMEIERLKAESPIGQRLHSHPHIIKPIGTYWKAQNHFNILTFPVATCDLGHLLDICQTRWADGDSQTADQVERRPNSSVVAGGALQLQ